MALKLFEHPLSPYAQKVKIALCEKALPFDRVFVDPSRAGDDPAYQEFVLASPRREVPALVDGPVRLADSTVILEYLDERYPKPSLSPEQPADRARVRMLEEMMDTEYEAVNWGIMELKVFERASGALADQLLTRAALQLQRLWNRLERELEGRRFMNGTEFGRGDAAVHPHIAVSQGLGYPLSDLHPRLLAWEQRVASRSSVKRVVNESAEFLRRLHRPDTASEAPVVRQYRDHRLEWMMKTGGAPIVTAGLADGTIRFAEEHE
jgi:glutathione S-transferase/RNA polymerase-associated protein